MDKSEIAGALSAMRKTDVGGAKWARGESREG